MKSETAKKLTSLLNKGLDEGIPKDINKRWTKFLKVLTLALTGHEKLLEVQKEQHQTSKEVKSLITDHKKILEETGDFLKAMNKSIRSFSADQIDLYLRTEEISVKNLDKIKLPSFPKFFEIKNGEKLNKLISELVKVNKQASWVFITNRKVEDFIPVRLVVSSGKDGMGREKLRFTNKILADIRVGGDLRGDGKPVTKEVNIANTPIPVTDNGGSLTVDGVPQLTVVNAIDEVAFDLNAAAFSEVTAITNDYIFDSIVLNFSTVEVKTITITGQDGTILWGGNVDQTSDNKGYNTTAKHFNLIFNQAFNANDNITITITQFGSPGTVDVILKIREGSSTLGGSPVLGAGDSKIGAVESVDPSDVTRRGEFDSKSKVPVFIDIEHSRIHGGNAYKVDKKITGTVLDLAFKVPSGIKRMHLIFQWAVESKAHIEVYEGRTWDPSTGSQLTIFNRDRNSANTSQVQEDTTGSFAANMAVVQDPTNQSGGTVIHDEYSWSDKKQTIRSRDIAEFILKNDEVYIVKLTSDDGSKGLHLTLHWYENTDE